jgi:hypothetical protein
MRFSLDVAGRADYHSGMESNPAGAASVVELREVAREAGVGPVAAPAPVRLDDLRRRIIANQASVALLARLAAKAS